MEEFTDRMYSCAIHYDSSILNLPEKFPFEIVVPMSDTLKATYEEVKKGILSELPGEDFSNPKFKFSFLGKLSKLRQVTAGFLILPNGRIQYIDETPKLDYLEDYVDLLLDRGEAIVIWTIFKESMALIKKRLSKKGVGIITLSGDDKPAQREDKILQYQNDNTYQICIGQEQAGGIGTNLFKTTAMGQRQHTIFFENLVTPEAKTQAEKRTLRIGQTIDCQFTDIFVENSLDEWVLDCVKSGTNLIELLTKRGINRI